MSASVKTIIDADFIKYLIAGACEKRSISVTHKETGKTRTFDTRTDFWGGWREKEGGWIGRYNSQEKVVGGWVKPISYEDFLIEDVQTADPIENALHSCKMVVDGILKKHNTRKYKLFLGEGVSFREGLSTIVQYKGTRKDLLKPLLLGEISDYLIRKYKAEVVTGIEADDACVMECYNKKDHILVGVDKDYLGCPINYWDYNKPENGVVDCDSYGGLYLDKKGTVRGYGRAFFWFQVASGDRADNYFANSASDIKWGDKSAYKVLKDCTNDKEVVSEVVGIYKHLYPTPKTITGWRGDEIEVDWLYVMSENFHLARILRWEGDEVGIGDVLGKYKLV